MAAAAAAAVLQLPLRADVHRGEAALDDRDERPGGGAPEGLRSRRARRARGGGGGGFGAARGEVGGQVTHRHALGQARDDGGEGRDADLTGVREGGEGLFKVERRCRVRRSLISVTSLPHTCQGTWSLYHTASCSETLIIQAEVRLRASTTSSSDGPSPPSPSSASAAAAAVVAVRMTRAGLLPPIPPPDSGAAAALP